MAEHLSKTNKLDNPRQMRFNDNPFVEDIESLMNLVNKEITDKYIKVRPQVPVSWEKIIGQGQAEETLRGMK